MSQPQLNVWIDGDPEAKLFPLQSLGFWIYDELREAAKKPASEHGLRLTLAYLAVVGKEPEKLAEIKEWAREHQVTVTLPEPPDPTP
jgi:hypothetical protein